MLYCLATWRAAGGGQRCGGCGRAGTLARAGQPGGDGGLRRYERLPHRLLAERGIKAAVVNALAGAPVRKAAGLLAKTDRLDAAVIASFGAFAKPAPTPLRAGARAALAETPGLSPPAPGRDHGALPAAGPSALAQP